MSPAHRPPVGLAAALRSGKATSLRYDLDALTEFERAVLAKALEIPAGEVRPYGWIAREIGRPKAVRAVGTALGRNPVPLLIPCHRVVRSDGRIGNYALWPFGRSVVRRPRAGIGSLIGNIIWIILLGWELALGHLFAGIALCLTIIGIPLGLANFKLIPISLLPLGVEIVPSDELYPGYR